MEVVVEALFFENGDKDGSAIRGCLWNVILEAVRDDRTEMFSFSSLNLVP